MASRERPVTEGDLVDAHLSSAHPNMDRNNPYLIKNSSTNLRWILNVKTALYHGWVSYLVRLPE
ncbi:hypothetical protein PHLCEN_2v5467 [Hermanssonia centrifuga]|uniref:Uncharacterized protein n=1 Tax=Hermanssonia centrifuga TaxID=98765 RepID=A0A2R6P2B9_9APHY|nr:hypothetical protein PHLCEN_2v5467 [Hermanssonia centrifuga]